MIKDSKSTQEIKQYQDYLHIERGLSLNTVYSYLKDIMFLYTFLLAKKPSKNLLSATEEDLKSYLKKIYDKSFSSKTQARKISSMKSFYNFLYSEKIILKNPAINLESPNIEKSLPKFLTEEEVIKLLETAKNLENKKIYTMLEILYSTGLRVSELVSLKTTNIIDNQTSILVLGKGSKERKLPLTKIATESIKTYTLSKYFNQKSPWLFSSNKAKSGHISRERFAQLLKDLAIASNINHNKVSPHILRHSFATHMYQRGTDLRVLQSMLGHKDISTTEIYTHVSTQNIQEMLQDFHPLTTNDLYNIKK
jgi:integrase/recombinase XerD